MVVILKLSIGRRTLKFDKIRPVWVRGMTRKILQEIKGKEILIGTASSVTRDVWISADMAVLKKQFIFL